MTKAKELPSQQYLKECFDYDQDTGYLTWRVRPASHFKTEKACKIWNTRFSCKRSDSIDRHGYIRVSVDSIRYRAHRLIWMLVIGADPIDQIDHIDENKANNRFSNLREANSSQNKHNQGKAKSNTTGLKGVTYDKQLKKYRARLWTPEKNLHLGVFNTKQEAHDAWCIAATKMQGDFVNYG